MAKPEWGLKRLCPNCGTRYYDMRHDPIVCPKCGAHFDAEAVVKTRRSRAAVVTETALGPIVAEEVDPELVAAIASEDVPDVLPPTTDGTVEIESDVEGEADEEAVEGEAETEEEEQEVLEDASELGEDEDDMAEVIENVDEDEER
ncbi:MAG: TIGR02300 family protein [Stellaceae bacterium]